MSPKLVLAVGASLLAYQSLAVSQGLPPGVKQRALEQAVCVLPYGQTIEATDLPRPSIDPNWCSKLRDDLPLSLVSIPATHDAGTALGKTGWTRCQVLTIPAQLALGVRGFDVRLRLVGQDLLVYHGEESQSLSFNSVMSAMRDFLTQNRREFIVMRIREESAAIGANQTFEAAFSKIAELPAYSGLFYHAASRTEIPTVDAVRGKILLLDNYGKLTSAVDYPNPTMSVQDDYDTSDMDKKLQEITAKFEDAGKQTTGAVWNVNYTSSSTVKVDQLANANAVNEKVQAYLAGQHHNLGLVFMNFPGVIEIKEIINSNFGSG